MRQQIGGNFAPPLTDEKLAAYAEMIEASPDSRVRDLLRVAHKCCSRWWDLPESTEGVETPHPVGRGMVMPLDEPIKQDLYDLIPWKDEIEGMKLLFDDIEKDIAERNTKALEGWQLSVKQAVVQKYFPSPEKLKASIAAYNVYKSVGMGWLADVLPAGSSKESVDVVMKSVLEFEVVYKACEAETVQAIRNKAHPQFPYPTLEPTPLRDAAHHLLWHVIELDLDREPITKDKLAGAA